MGSCHLIADPGIRGIFQPLEERGLLRFLSVTRAAGPPRYNFLYRECELVQFSRLSMTAAHIKSEFR